MGIIAPVTLTHVQPPAQQGLVVCLTEAVLLKQRMIVEVWGENITKTFLVRMQIAKVRAETLLVLVVYLVRAFKALLNNALIWVGSGMGKIRTVKTPIVGVVDLTQLELVVTVKTALLLPNPSVMESI
jgi:hypothetical protein